ncbi:MAG TPA: DUF1684 domain-containing protein [Bryobacteraceae bacterium]|nr:DUF1684 domain-containing protein [Bryobacteraceae bacterium]
MLAATLMAVSENPLSHADSIRAWQKHREEGLRSETGWLSLVGLFWLKPGDNTIGSAGSNDFVLPKKSAPAAAGKFHFDGSTVTFVDAAGASKTLSTDEEAPATAKIGTVSLFLIKRGDRYAIRAKDSYSPVLVNFKGMKYFPINEAMNFEAKFVPDAKKIPMLNILGQTDTEESPGMVEFTVKDKPYHLRALYEDTASGKTLYFLFKDTTNKSHTYQAGRMLNVPLPEESGVVHLDFNRAYNPPCTFTPYATCPLPPAENRLPFAVEAGELRYGKGHPESPGDTD